jgi:hypothetical protein
MNKQPLAVMKKPATMLGVPPVGPAVAAAPPAIIQENTGAVAVPKNIIQARDLLYRLIISQLFYDGYQQVAVTLSNMGKFFNLQNYRMPHRLLLKFNASFCRFFFVFG